MRAILLIAFVPLAASKMITLIIALINTLCLFGCCFFFAFSFLFLNLNRRYVLVCKQNSEQNIVQKILGNRLIYSKFNAEVFRSISKTKNYWEYFEHFKDLHCVCVCVRVFFSIVLTL